MTQDEMVGATAARQSDNGKGAAIPSIPDHELLQRMGEGSYGEVWVARATATGTLRAVKIVRRSRFESDKPYEREFTGLKNIEPVSRAHEGLVDILQVGRNDADGFFYYVMELADDAGAEPAGPAASVSPIPPSALATPSSYRPLSLDSYLRQKGRLPVKECVKLGIGLAEALAYLHSQKLVHRDIKPSNIIFVGGVPKLADVGLVAQTESARSYVGTEGYFPPEGPGTVKADIYGLGKCLYEMATAKDRLAFPSLPTQLDELANQPVWRELNDVFNKACAPEPKDRYANASQLLADLRLLEKGQSPRRARRRRKATWAAASAAIVLTLLAAGLVEHGRQLKRVVTPELGIGWPTGNLAWGDLNGDGEAELVTGEDGVISVFSKLGEPQFKRREVPGYAKGQFALCGTVDVDASRREKIVSSWTDGTNLCLKVCEPGLSTLVELLSVRAEGALTKGPKGPKGDSILSFWGLLRLPSPASTQILASIVTHYRLQPREFRSYEWPTGRLLWTNPIAGGLVDVKSADLDGDGVPEVLAGTYATHNGVTNSGQDDSHSYVLAYDHRGKPLWSRITGGPCVKTELQIAQQAGSNYIYVLARRDEDPKVRKPSGKPPMGRLLKLDCRGSNVLAAFKTTNTLTSFALTPFGPSGMLTVLATDNRGTLLEFDEDLRLLRQVQVVPRPRDSVEATNSGETRLEFDEDLGMLRQVPPLRDWVELSILAVDDLDGDGRPEIVLQSSQIKFISGANAGRDEGEANNREAYDHLLQIYDMNLRLQADYPIESKTSAILKISATVLPRGRNGRRDIAIVKDRIILLEFCRQNTFSWLASKLR
jgi:hypothetical protein